jgi:hypothetical protein
MKKFTAENFLFYFSLSKIAIYLSLGLHNGRPSYRRRLRPQKRTFSPYWIRIQPIKIFVDPDGSGSNNTATDDVTDLAAFLASLSLPPGSIQSPLASSLPD